jgi:glycosyltransferase involved in cell wall biosynthesis
MRIAQVAPLFEAVPPKLYGGTERIVAYLCDALVGLGHEVTLFASADSQCLGRLMPMRDQAIRLDACTLSDGVAAHLAMLHEVRERADEFDALHFHTDLLHFPFFESLAERTLTTVHGRLDFKDYPASYRRWRAFPLVSISDRQRAPLRFANWAGTVHHGLPVSLYRPPPQPTGDYLAFVGRVSPEKRLDRAIEIARRAGVPLRIAAKVDEKDATYFRDVIQPLLHDPLIDFRGEIGEDVKSEFLGNAKALLFPIDWPEPFGLVVIESLACGTPVIAWDCGSVPEIVEPGVTGYVVRTIEEAVESVARVGGVSRKQIRHAFELRFSSTVMAMQYLTIYSRLGARTQSLKETA